MCKLDRAIEKVEEPVKVTCPQDAVTYLRGSHFIGVQDWEQEEFVVLLFNPRGEITYKVFLYRGFQYEIAIQPSEVFKHAVRFNAKGIMIAHNHPSGRVQPSEADLCLTGKLREAAKLLNLDFLDHLILTGEDWVSIAEVM